MRETLAAIVTVGNARIIGRLTTGLHALRQTVACICRSKWIPAILLLHLDYIFGSGSICPMLLMISVGLLVCQGELVRVLN